jgi:indole-3-glycerol phosphate synthase
VSAPARDMVLDGILEATRREIARRREAVPAAALERTALGRARRRDAQPFLEAVRRPGLSLIAEHKRRSPSAGPIRDGISVEDVVRAYERGGAAALSILTDGPSFGGSLEDLRRARAACALPILRKDFILDAYQLHEALLADADAILLIVAALSNGELASLHRRACELGLTVLVEVHDERELERAAQVDASLIGINNRDLRTMKTDTRRTFALLERMPDGAAVVAESGFSNRRQLDELAGAGVDAVLIGEAMMRAPDIEAACRELAVPT